MMRRAAFPIWRVMRDEEVVPYQGPVIHFHARPGHYQIERVYLWQEWVGAIISLGALLLLWWACRSRGYRRANQFFLGSKNPTNRVGRSASVAENF